MFNRIKEWIMEIIKSRLFVTVIAFCVLFAILIQRVFYLQIVKGQYYLDNYKLQIRKTREVPGQEETFMTGMENCSPTMNWHILLRLRTTAITLP